jgi:formate--tetrahydrofolate ligase
MGQLLSPQQIAEKLDVAPADYVPYGDGVAKLRAESAFLPEGTKLGGKLVLVSAITPSPAGEGKTTISIGLTDALRVRGVNAIAALRQPSLGPTLGSKGGGAGGGRARLEPFERVNLGLTGDIHAVTSAHNLLASMVDNALHFSTVKGLDARRVEFPRVIDLDDRSLRHVTIGLGGVLQGIPRESRFDITAASEVMAVLCLSRDYADLKARLARLRVASTKDGTAITAADVGAVGGMAVVLREAMLPNLAQTFEGSPAMIHGGPFGNIAHGCSSIVATRWALSRAEVVVTEAGFGFDLGAEKFFDIKCRAAGVWPHALVLVATCKALKVHGGTPLARANEPDEAALRKGFGNLRHHLATAKNTYGLEATVAINVFPGDTESELALLESLVRELGHPVARSTGYTAGADGGLALADAVKAQLAKADANPTPRPLYPLEATLEAKIEAIAKTIYGATAVEYSVQAKKDLARAEAAGLAGAPVCMAKTHLSLTADSTKGGCPQPHVLPIQAARLSAGAGFVVALCGDIMTMPGLGREPAVLGMSLTDGGEIVGLK